MPLAAGIGSKSSQSKIEGVAGDQLTAVIVSQGKPFLRIYHTQTNNCGSVGCSLRLHNSQAPERAALLPEKRSNYESTAGVP